MREYMRFFIKFLIKNNSVKDEELRRTGKVSYIEDLNFFKNLSFSILGFSFAGQNRLTVFHTA
jgi:hypothetical protein